MKNTFATGLKHILLTYLFFTAPPFCFGSAEIRSIGSQQELESIYHHYRSTASDINQHLPVLRELARQSSSAAEIGTGSTQPTWAILMGLSESDHPHPFFLEIQSKKPPLEKHSLTKRLAKENGIRYLYMEADDFNVEFDEEVDLLFIDGLHTYCHLTYQLDKFSPKVKKYLVMHDTSPPWGYQNDTVYKGNYSEYPAYISRQKKGLSPAVDDFLARNPGWVLKERRFNNYGLTILERKEKPKMAVNPAIHVYIHVCTLAHWKDVLNRQLGRITSSGLYDACETINLGVLGTGDLSSFENDYPKLKVLFRNPDVNLYERPTLLSLHEKCLSKPDGSIILYLHTKGITRISPTVTDWSKFMEYFMIDQWKVCVEALKLHDVCGVNWQLGPAPHFSGNFWWTTSAYASTLPHQINGKYLDPEMWLCQNRPVFKCFHYSNIDHYYTPYPESKYTLSSQQ